MILAEHFAESCSPNCDLRKARLKTDYEAMKTKYVGLPYPDDHASDVDLMDKIITELKKNKAAGLDYLTAEHLHFSHPIVVSIMCKLFNIMMSYGYVPASFGRSYTISLPKGNAILGKALMIDDFRGISVSAVLSKIFEHCIGLLDRFLGEMQRIAFRLMLSSCVYGEIQYAIALEMNYKRMRYSHSHAEAVVSQKQFTTTLSSCCAYQSNVV